MNQIACIQMNSSANIRDNVRTAHQLINQAASQGAQLIILPENFAFMTTDEKAKLNHRELLDQGPLQDFLSSTASEQKVWIVGGTIPLGVPWDKNKVFASCLLFNDRGERVGRYDKIHLFDVALPETNETYNESKTIEPGKEIVVVQTPFGRIGLSICYDLRFPELFRAMQTQQVEIIVLPSAFTYTTGVAHWESLIRARAIENLCFFAAACQVGVHEGQRKTFGHSMIVNPWGEILACLPDQPGSIIAEINLEFLQTLRQHFPALTHRKI